MIPLDIADLVLVASRTLHLDTGATLAVLDVKAAEIALAEAALAGGLADGAPTGDLADATPTGGPAGGAPAGRLGDAAPAGGLGGDDGAVASAAAAALLTALIRHHPLRHGNGQVAVVAALQFLAVNGWRADLDPPGAAQAVIADLTSGVMAAADLAAWLSPRLSRSAGPDRSGPPTQEAPMRGKRPRRRRAPRTKGLGQHRFTDRARHVIVLAQDEAREFDHNFVGTEHLLLGLLREGHGVAARALQSLGIGLKDARRQVEEIIGRGGQTPPEHIPLTPRAKKVLELSLREALVLDHLYIGTEHILLGLFREGGGVAVDVLARLGAGRDQVRHAVVELLATRAAAPREAVLPPGLRAYDDRIALVRSEKDAAIDTRDFEQAAALRDSEKSLLAQRAERIAEWSAGTDVAALGEELDRLHREVARLQGLLRQHGIEPGAGDEQTA